jgi:hypothetical protein
VRQSAALLKNANATLPLNRSAVSTPPRDWDPQKLFLGPKNHFLL